MKNPFDQKLKLWKQQIPRDVTDAAIFVTDTLDVCWASAQSVFEERATPDIALAIYDRLVKRMAESASEEGTRER